MPQDKKLRSIPCHCINTRRAASAITAYYDQIMKPCKVTVNQFSLLWSLDGLGQSNVSQLAEHVGLERSTVVRNLKPLVKEGFINDSAQRNSRDRQLLVTAKGKELIAQGVPLWKKAQKDIYRLVSDEEIKVFRKVISELQKL